MHLKIAENSSPNQGNLVSVSKKRKLFLHITRGKILKAPQAKIIVIGTTFTQKRAQKCKEKTISNLIWESPSGLKKNPLPHREGFNPS